jgi:hypothetical protein
VSRTRAELWKGGPALPTKVGDGYIYTYEGSDSFGLPMWSCTRPGAGICGYGLTDKDALNDFLDKDQELLPDPKSAEVERAIDDQMHAEAFDERN